MKLLYCRKMIGLPFVDKIVISDDSATSNGSLILSIPVFCAAWLSSDVQKIKAANLPFLMQNLSMYMLEKELKQKWKSKTKEQKLLFSSHEATPKIACYVFL